MKNYEAWKIEPLDLSRNHTKEEIYRHLVGWAVLAANSHNSQPWRFVLRPDDNRILVVLDGQAVLPASDKVGRQAHISIGCALQNLIMAIEAYGLSLQVIYRDISDGVVGETVLAEVSLGDEQLKPLNSSWAMFSSMKNRRMYRGQYDPQRALPIDVVSSFESAAAAKTGAELKLITDRPTIFAIAEIQYLADRAVIALNNFRRELADYLLPNDTDSCTGMPGNTFGLSDEMSKNVHLGLSQPGTFDPALAAGMAITGRDGIRSAPMLGVISVSDDKPEFWLKAGQAFQHIAVIAESNNLFLAVHAAMVEVGMFNVSLKARLVQLKRPTVIFRVGYADERHPHSPRLMADAVIK
ncbi:MAG: hypothetical protein Q8O87_00365 [bacterium]|nr:hypothetical protein [bacterium]